MALNNDEGGMLGRMDSKEMCLISPMASTWGQEAAKTPKSKGDLTLTWDAVSAQEGWLSKVGGGANISQSV